MEKTFIMVKPDGVQRNLIGEIISRLAKPIQKMQQQEPFVEILLQQWQKILFTVLILAHLRSVKSHCGLKKKTCFIKKIWMHGFIN